MIDSSSIQGLAAWLQRHVRRHNLHVLSLAGASFCVTGILWALAYGVAAWLTLLWATVYSGSQGQEAMMPASFPRHFLTGAGVLLLAACLRQVLRRNDAPRDRKGLNEHLLDLLLALPATTLAVWGNLSAWLWLNQRELRQAARLVECILEQRRLPLSSAPVVIPNDERREKIVLSLLLTGILEMRRDEGTSYLCLTRSVAPQLLLSTGETMEAEIH